MLARALVLSVLINILSVVILIKVYNFLYTDLLSFQTLSVSATEGLSNTKPPRLSDKISAKTENKVELKSQDRP